MHGYSQRTLALFSCIYTHTISLTDILPTRGNAVVLVRYCFFGDEKYPQIEPEFASLISRMSSGENAKMVDNTGSIACSE